MCFRIRGSLKLMFKLVIAALLAVVSGINDKKEQTTVGSNIMVKEKVGLSRSKLA